MEFLRVVRRRTLLSEVIYVLLNLALAAAVLVLTVSTGTPWLALLLVLLSKWRVLAVRPRYWFAHVEANMVDMIVSISVVLLIYLAGQAGTATGDGFATQVVLGVLYAAWLLLLKPRAKRSFVAAQAAVAVAVGSMALASLSYELPSSVVVILVWVIGYASARHVFTAYSDNETRFLSLLWGFVFAEIGWVTYHWTIAYSLPFGSVLKLPQVTLLLLGISFLAERVYSSYVTHGKIRPADMTPPLLLVLGVFIVLMLFFNSASIGSV